MAEFNLKRANGGTQERMRILDRDGSLKTPNEYGAIPLAAGQYRCGVGIPYFFKTPKVRDGIYCADGLGDRETYMIWHNGLYSAGYGATLVGNDRRHLAVNELEQIGRNVWAQVFETPRKTRCRSNTQWK